MQITNFANTRKREYLDKQSRQEGTVIWFTNFVKNILTYFGSAGIFLIK